MAQKVNFNDKVLSRIDRLNRESLQSHLERLSGEREQFEGALNQISEGVALVDQQGKILWVNRRAALWLALRRSFREGSPILELAGDPLIQRFLDDRLKSPEFAASEELDVLTPREMTLRLHWNPLDLTNAKGALLRLEDISAEKGRKEGEDRTQRTEALIRLAAGVAHEIGNPLNSIQIHLELLRQEIKSLSGKRGEGLRKTIDVIRAETRRLDQIVRAFLKTARRPALCFRKDSVNDILSETLEVLRPEMSEHNVQCALRLTKNLPEFLLDRDRLQQAFINLIKNAIEAMPKGGELRAATGFKEWVCLVSFEDKGRGIEAKHLPHIFEPYYTTKSEGSGLGLSQVDLTVREHGGRIEVDSKPGRGSIFTLLLPIRLERLSLPEPVPGGGSS